VYFDDGARVLAVSHPLIVLFFAIGLGSPAFTPLEMRSGSRLARYGSWGLLIAAVLFTCVPWIAHHISPAAALMAEGSPQKDGVLVFGGRRMSGVLVVDDGQPLRGDVPTLHLADFEAVIKQSEVESYQGLLHPVTPSLPFGFVYAPRIEKGAFSSNQFIVPAEVVERRDVPAWHFQLEPWRHKPDAPGNYWFNVTKAEPWAFNTPP
jgi:hypothetical protein